MHETEKKQNVTEYLEYIEHILEALSLFDGKLIGETSGQRFLMTEGCSSYDFRKVTDLQAYIEYKIEEICRMKNEKEKMVESDSVLCRGDNTLRCRSRCDNQCNGLYQSELW